MLSCQGDLAEPLELEERVGGLRRRHHPTSCLARSATCSGVKPNSLHHGVAGRRGAEAIERDERAARTDPAVPAERRAGLDGDARGDRRRQDALAILRRLCSSNSSQDGIDTSRTRTPLLAQQRLGGRR